MIVKDTACLGKSADAAEAEDMREEAAGTGSRRAPHVMLQSLDLISKLKEDPLWVFRIKKYDMETEAEKLEGSKRLN